MCDTVTAMTTFMAAPSSSLAAIDADIVFLGAPHGTPYPSIDHDVHAGAANALRAAIASDAAWIEHHDYDLGGPVLAGGARLVDVGDLETTSGDGPRNRALIEDATRRVLAAGGAPIVVGGDDSVPIPFLRGFADAGPITVLQIDAHIDWRDEREGEHQGFSSTMRRASEMPHVAGIVQAGTRGLGSARAGELETAAAYGARIVTAAEIARDGVGAALRHLPDGAAIVIALDYDALDAAAMPAVAAPSPGGLSYRDVIDLIDGVVARGRLVGMNGVEFVPARDVTGVAAYTAARILWHAIGRIARQRTG